MPVSRPTTSVVVPYYDAPGQLDLLLTALGRQTALGSFEVVVADDGSDRPPRPPDGLPYSCTVVRQDDRGFRAAAARNLGAASASGDVLLFLDGDVVPTATYVQRMTDAVRRTDDGHGVLVVGRRRHFRRSPTATGSVLALPDDGDGPLPPGIRIDPDPAWLSDGYRRTDNLRQAGDEDFRLVISAVVGSDRRMWDATGGFDASFVGYGGEDWDLGWRSWLSGADWRHVPNAVAWHDGPDAGARAISTADKNAETIRLASTVPLPSARGTGLIHEVPAVAVRYHGPVIDDDAEAADAADAAVIDCVAGLLDRADAGVWFPGLRGRDQLPPLLREDTRVHAGDVPGRVLARAPFTVDIHRPLRLSVPLPAFCAAGDRVVPGWITARHTRSAHRGVRPDVVDAERAGLRAIDAQLSLERRWGGW